MISERGLVHPVFSGVLQRSSLELICRVSLLGCDSVFLTGSPVGGGRESLFCIVEIVLSVEGFLHPIFGICVTCGQVT